MNTFHSDANENVSVVNETGPIFVKVHPFFGRPVGKMCEDQHFNEKEKVKLHELYRVKIKNEIFSTSIYLQNITRVLGQ